MANEFTTNMMYSNDMDQIRLYDYSDHLFDPNPLYEAYHRREFIQLIDHGNPIIMRTCCFCNRRLVEPLLNRYKRQIGQFLEVPSFEDNLPICHKCKSKIGFYIDVDNLNFIFEDHDTLERKQFELGFVIPDREKIISLLDKETKNGEIFLDAIINLLLFKSEENKFMPYKHALNIALYNCFDRGHKGNTIALLRKFVYKNYRYRWIAEFKDKFTNNYTNMDEYSESEKYPTLRFWQEYWLNRVNIDEWDSQWDSQWDSKNSEDDEDD